MDLTIEAGGDGTLLLSGELDMASAPALAANMAPLLEGHPRVVLDLSELTFIDSAGISVIAHVVKELVPRNGILVLRHPVGIVMRLLEVVAIEEWPGVVVERDAP